MKASPGKQSIGDPVHGKASSMRQLSRNSEVSIYLKIGSSSSAEQVVKVDVLCIEKLTNNASCY
jgi:hypothetical protein